MTFDESMTFDEMLRNVEGLPDAAMMQVPRVLSEATKKKLDRKTPDEISRIVAEAINEVNRGSVKPLNELIRQRL